MKSKRIEVIDALRGFTLIGILMIHSYSFYFETTGISIQELGQYEEGLAALVSRLFSGTLYTIFSFLFGISFAIQLQNAAQKGKSFKGLFLWRLCILLMIGCLHRLFFSADILRVYAALGSVLILCVYLNKRQTLILSAVLFLISVGVRVYYAALPEVVDPSLGLAADMEFLIRSGRLFLIPSLFILGLYAGKVKFFNDNYHNHKLYLKLLGGSALILFASGVAYLAARQLGMPHHTGISETYTIIEKTMLSVLYVALIVLWYRMRIGHRLLHWLVPIGKMGLSIYISQSVFLIYFYQIEPGLLSKLSLGGITLITLLVVMLQREFARWWCRHFRFGPVEYAWRRLTYINGTASASSAQDLGSRNASRNLRPNSKCLETETEREA